MTNQKRVNENRFSETIMRLHLRAGASIQFERSIATLNDQVPFALVQSANRCCRLIGPDDGDVFDLVRSPYP